MPKYPRITTEQMKEAFARLSRERSAEDEFVFTEGLKATLLMAQRLKQKVQEGEPKRIQRGIKKLEQQLCSLCNTWDLLKSQRGADLTPPRAGMQGLIG